MLICLHMPWVLYPALVIGPNTFIPRFKTQSSEQLQHSSFYPLFHLHRQLKETRRGGSRLTHMHYSEDKAYHSWWTFKRTLSHRGKRLAFNKAKWQCGYVAVCVWQVGVCSHLSSGDSRLSSFRHVKGSRDLAQVHTHLQHWATG